MTEYRLTEVIRHTEYHVSIYPPTLWEIQSITEKDKDRHYQVRITESTIQIIADNCVLLVNQFASLKL